MPQAAESRAAYIPDAPFTQGFRQRLGVELRVIFRDRGMVRMSTSWRMP
jgi:hypothetical protein